MNLVQQQIGISLTIAAVWILSSVAAADYQQLLSSGTTRAEVEELYSVYAKDILGSSNDEPAMLAELAGSGGYKDSFLLACLSNGWTVRSRDIHPNLLPPSGLWAYSEPNFQGLLRQYPSDVRDSKCLDINSFGDFSIQSIRVGAQVRGKLFAQETAQGASIELDGELATLAFNPKSGRLRTRPRIDYASLSDYERDAQGVRIRLHISGANIDDGAVILVDQNESVDSTVTVRMDNAQWLGLGQDIAGAGYNFDPTYYHYPIFHYASIATKLDRLAAGQTIVLQVRNPDGQLSNELKYKIPRPDNLDSDGDGLLDVWETDGIDDLNLAAMGADPYRKDLFVEVDRMIVPGRVWSDFSEEKYPRREVFDSAVKVFQHAPIINPDGSTGIQLHVDYGQSGFQGSAAKGGTEIPWQRYIGFKKVEDSDVKDPTQYCNATLLRQDPKYFDANRLKAFRYCIFADQQWSSRSTGRGNESTICLLTLGVCRMNAIDHNYQLGVFTHELGHLLGLGHAGDQSARWFNNKPNFNSLMNYLFTFPGQDADGKLSGFDEKITGDFVYAYSEGMRAPLDEGRLYEVLGVANHYPRDWNQNGRVDAGSVVFKLRNPDYKKTDTLTDDPDWARLRLTMER